MKGIVRMFITLLLLPFSLYVSAQQSVTGVVADSATHDPLPMADAWRKAGGIYQCRRQGSVLHCRKSRRQPFGELSRLPQTHGKGEFGAACKHTDGARSV